MGIGKLKLDNIFLFLYLAIFPFGQIIRIGILQPIDLVVGLAAAYTFFWRLEKPEVFKYLENFLFIAGFSWIFGLALFGRIEVFYGLLYFLRLVAYSYFLIYVWNFAKNRINKALLLDSLSALSVVTAIFGWIQYFAFPLFWAFRVWGWDEHTFRLVGTFLDPPFIGLILVFGFLITIYRYILTGKQKYIFLSVFLLVSLGFTYSRGSYLALIAGLASFAIFYKKLIVKFSLIALALILIILLLPTHNVMTLEFSRAFTAIARLGSYGNAITIAKTSPIFGVGYGNFCLANLRTFGVADFSSHSCSGSDSSLLLVLATTGVVGLIVFVLFIAKSVRYTKFDILYTSSLIALLVHSLFNNSIFYPWIMGWMVILLSVGLRREIKG